MTSPYFFPYDNRIENNNQSSRVCAFLRAVRGFLLSPEFMLLPAFVAMACALFGEEYTMLSLIVNAQLFAFSLFFCDDFAAAMMPFLAVMCQGATLFGSWETIVPYILPWGIAPAVSLVFHLAVYRKPLRNGITLYGLAATAAAVLLGGLFAPEKLSPLESTEGAFYYFGLSLGMLLLYFLFSANYKRLKDYNVYEHLLWQMLFTALICSGILLYTFFSFRDGVTIDLAEFRNQTTFRNSLANIMIMGLPAPFYFAGKRSLPLGGKLFSFALGLLFYASLCLTTSRTAMVFGTVLFVLCLIYYFKRGEGRLGKILSLCLLLAAFSPFLSFLPRLIDIFKESSFLGFLKDFPESLVDLEKQEARVKFFFRAAEDLLANPLFGVGILSQKNVDVYEVLNGCMCWYHMYFPQIFGSMGLFGAAAYTLHLGLRARLMCFRADNLSRALSLTALSLFLYSMTDPGEFMPIPFGMMAMLVFVLLERHMEAHPDSLAEKPRPFFPRKMKKNQKTIDKTPKI